MFMRRTAEDDLAVLDICDAAESIDAVVVAITVSDSATYTGALASHLRYNVWIRVKDEEHIDLVDAKLLKEDE